MVVLLVKTVGPGKILKVELPRLRVFTVKKKGSRTGR